MKLFVWKKKKLTGGGHLRWTFSRFWKFKLWKLYLSWCLNLCVIIPVWLRPMWAESDQKWRSRHKECPELGVKTRCPELGTSPCTITRIIWNHYRINEKDDHILLTGLRVTFSLTKLGLLPYFNSTLNFCNACGWALIIYFVESSCLFYFILQLPVLLADASRDGSW